MTVREILKGNVITQTIHCKAFQLPKYEFIEAQEEKRRFFGGPAEGLQVVDVKQNTLEHLVSFIEMAEFLFDWNKTLPKLYDMLSDYCNKYGLPFAQMIACEEGQFLCISLEDFSRKISDLYTRYRAWCSLQLGYDEPLKKYNPFFSGQERRFDLQAMVEIQSNHNMQVRIAYEKGVPRLYYQCETLLDLASIQLSFLISYGEHYLDNGSIDFCKFCGTPYLKTRKNLVSCSNCHSPNERKRRSIQKKQRGQKANAEKEGKQ